VVMVVVVVIYLDIQEMHSSSLQGLPRPLAKNELIMALCMYIRVYVSLLFCGILVKVVLVAFVIQLRMPIMVTV